MAKSKEEKLKEKEEKTKVKKAKQEEKKKVKEEKKLKKKEKGSSKKVKDEEQIENTQEIKPRVEKNKFSIFNIFLKLILIITIASSIFAIYNLTLLDSIEDTLRYVAMGVIVLIDIIFILMVFIKRKRKRPKKKIGTLILLILFAIIYIAVGSVINYLYSQVSNINKDIVTYSSCLITMSTNQAQSIEDIKNYRIGILDDEKSPEGYIIPQELVAKYKLNDENQLVKYSDYSTMIVDLYANEIDAIFISSSYVESFKGITGYEMIETDTKIITSQDKDMKKTETSEKEVASVNKSVTEPFTILLMGIDSTAEVLSKNAVANGDTLILITFNPKTLNATMVSIPRDTYLPIACWPRKDENKITHAAAYGNDCMMNTIEDYFGINIDYYAKINFKGLVKLVDAVGGVEVDVPTTLCTDDSSRYAQICIQPGRQVLNGEQALVFARNRKSLVNGDFGRAEHQQEIIMALINKMKTITEVSKFTQILNTVSNSLDTNLTTKQILSFYNVGKDILKRSNEASNLINIQQLYLTGASQMIYDERMRMVLYNYVPNTRSRDAIVQAMKENLELVEHEEITEFNFSINKTYEKEVIGKGYATSGTYRLLPNFIGLTRAQAQAKADGLGIPYAFNGEGNMVVSQSHPANKRLDKMKNETFVLNMSAPEKVEEDDEDKENSDDKDDNSSSETTTPDNGDSSTPTTPTTPDNGSSTEE